MDLFTLLTATILDLAQFCHFQLRHFLHHSFIRVLAGFFVVSFIAPFGYISAAKASATAVVFCLINQHLRLSLYSLILFKYQSSTLLANQVLMVVMVVMVVLCTLYW